MHAKILGLWALGGFVSLAAATFKKADTCDLIRTTTSIEIDGPLSLDYIDEQTHYWSTACSALRPSCIASPTTAKEVSSIVKILQNNTENFAVKSGGHSPNKFWASIEGAPLISTRRMKEVTLDKAAQTVRVGPGNRWVDVANALDQSGFTPVGGRIGDVGVGGLLIGGGLSFLSAQYGWAMSNVLEYEVVLANSTIVKATKDQNVDLYNALHGGGNQFGIVTSFLLKAHPIDNQVYSGLFIFTPDKESQILSAVRDFTANYDDHPKAAIISTTVMPLDLIESWVMFVFYDGPDPGDVFKPFLDIGPISNTAKPQSYASYLASNNFAALRGFTYFMTTETTPLPDKNNTQVLNTYVDFWRQIGKEIFLVAGIIPSIAYQPVPKRMLRAAKAAGGDLLDMDENHDYIIFEMNLSFVNLPLGWDDDTVAAAVERLFKGQKALVDGHIAAGRLPSGIHLPLFANDATYKQDYWSRIKTEKHDYAKKVKAMVDPNGFFTKRTGGWKL